MALFLLSFAVIGFAILGMGVGVLLGRRPLRGSCGGNEVLRACPLCPLEKAMTTRTVSQIMTRELVTFSPATNVHDAIQVLLERRLSGAPVVDESGKLVGMLSKKDCLRIVFTTGYHGDRGGPVREFMSAPVESLDADMDLVSATQHFLESPFRRFPVVRDGRLIGQISRCDILRALTADEPNPNRQASAAPPPPGVDAR